MGSNVSTKPYRPVLAGRTAKLPADEQDRQEQGSRLLRRKNGVLVYTGEPVGEIPEDVVEAAREEHLREPLP